MIRFRRIGPRLSPSVLALLAVVCGGTAGAWAADVLVVCPRPLQAALAPWIERRQAEGLSIERLEPEPTPDALRTKLREAARVGRSRFLLLVGDADPASTSDPAVRAVSTPTFHLPAKVNIHWGKERDIASDNPYADLDDDQLPDLAVGRLPADSPAELSVMVEKILRYESAADFSTWRRQINIVACLANFGGLIDAVLEQGARKFLTDGIPASHSTHVTYGNWKSPYCPDPRFFHQTTVDRLNEGCLFWVYIGHGHRQVVDRVEVPGRRSYHVFASADAAKLRCDRGAPIALFLACYTGAFDGEVDALGETLLKTPGAPVAVIAGSRVTMPYAMTVMGNELMRQYFEERAPTLGEMLRSAKREMATRPRDDAASKLLDTLALAMNPKSQDLRAERREHLELFNLLGDPTLRLPQPKRIELDAPGAVTKGQWLLVKGVCPIDGRATVELVLRRDRLRIRPPARVKYDDGAGSIEEFASTYRAANDPRLASRAAMVSAGPFEVSLAVPDSADGPCHVRMYVEGKADFAVGSKDVAVAAEDPGARANASASSSGRR